MVLACDGCDHNTGDTYPRMGKRVMVNGVSGVTNVTHHHTLR